MPDIFGTVLHPDNACIADGQETDALCSQLPISTIYLNQFPRLV